MKTGHPLAPVFRLILAASLAVSAILAAVFSLRWPLVGDASLIHYIAFLIERGWAPYRQLGDMNMPGSFLIELAAMHLIGPGALAWRLFDLTLALAASAAFFAFTPRRPQAAKSPGSTWLAALFAASLFFLSHTRDGLAQGGQRDLTMAVALLAATAFLLTAIHRNSFAAAALFGLLSGLALTIKPTTILLTSAQLLLALHATRHKAPPASRNRLLAPAALGYLIAPALSLAFLLHEHALRAFLDGLHTVVPYYASLGHRPLPYVLQHSLSPILPLAALWLILLALRRPALSLERRMLLAGIAFGLLNCILQQRALPYYRYPLLAFLLPLIALDLVKALTEDPTEASTQTPAGPTSIAPSLRARLTRPLAAIGLAFGALFLAPQSAILIHRYRWQQTDMLTSLQRDLESLRPAARQIQCIDSVSGCNTVLYRMRLEPATGVLSDFLLFGNTTDRQPPDAIPVIRDTRAAFSSAILARPPQVIVITSHLHMTGPEDFGKLARWPAFAAFLDTRYILATQWSPTRTERWWSREELPAAYRIYTLRAAP